MANVWDSQYSVRSTHHAAHHCVNILRIHLLRIRRHKLCVNILRIHNFINVGLQNGGRPQWRQQSASRWWLVICVATTHESQRVFYSALRHDFVLTSLSQLVNTFQSHVARYDATRTAIRAWQTQAHSHNSVATPRVLPCKHNDWSVHSSEKTARYVFEHRPCVHLAFIAGMIPVKSLLLLLRFLIFLLLILLLLILLFILLLLLLLPLLLFPFLIVSSSFLLFFYGATARQRTLASRFEFRNVTFYEQSSSAPRLTPNLEDQVSVFVTPRDSAPAISPGTRPLRGVTSRAYNNDESPRPLLLELLRAQSCRIEVLY